MEATLTARLLPTWAAWSAADLLRYLQRRTHVTYFAVCDEEQASPAQIEGVLTHHFCYNGETYHLPPGFDWRINPSPDREWLILLHKFYFAPGLGEAFCRTGDERYRQQWMALTAAWIDTVALDFLPSDVMGRRVQNWIFAHYYFCPTLDAADAAQVAFYTKWLASLHDQVNYLCTHLTPARNHRTIELYTIFMAAVVFPEFADAADWLALACRELARNIEADLRVDGVHCEQSTDYHHLVVKNYLGVKRLAQANRITLDPAFDERLQRALDFAMYAHRPDGLIPAMSDGDSRSFLDLLHQGYELYGNPAWLYVATGGRAGQAPAARSRTFPAGGYTVLRSGWGETGSAYADERYLLFDCGPLGVGNHGHLDLLSFEAAAFGQPLVVDPGRYTYHEPDPAAGATNWRAHFRGTAAHNTVQVDGLEQTRYRWQKNRFRICGPEPIWDLCTFTEQAEYTLVHGFAASAEYEVIHERIICLVQGTYWIITDLLRAPDDHRYDLRFHLDPHAAGRTTITVADQTTQIRAPHLLLVQPFDAQTQAHLEDGYVAYRYGVKQVAPVVRFHRHGADTIFHTVLYPFAKVAPQIQVEQLPGHSLFYSTEVRLLTGVRVTITEGATRYVDTLRVLQHQHRANYGYEYARQSRQPVATSLAAWRGNTTSRPAYERVYAGQGEHHALAATLRRGDQ